MRWAGSDALSHLSSALLELTSEVDEILGMEALPLAICMSCHTRLISEVHVPNLFQLSSFPLSQQPESQYKQWATETEFFHHVLASVSLSLLFPVSVLVAGLGLFFFFSPSPSFFHFNHDLKRLKPDVTA